MLGLVPYELVAKFADDEDLNRTGIVGGSNLHWVLLPSRLLNLGPSERLNSCQRLIPRSFDGEQSRS